MIDVSLSSSKRYNVAVIMLSTLLMLTISGCQKAPDADSVTDDTVITTQTTPASPAQNEQQVNQSVNSQVLTILALGDSLTEGLGVANDDNYPAQLEARLQEMGYNNVKVVNSGLSGETSSGLVNRLDWVTQTKPDITILTIGANDAIRGIDVAIVEANIRTAVKHLQDNGSEVILGGMQIYDNLGSDYVQSFAAMYPKIAKEMNVTLIPFFLDGVGGDPKLNQADAIHPTSEGYTIIVNDNILPILQPEVEQMLVAKTNKTSLPAPVVTN
ncbi:arylesterase [Psychrobacter frigidicola]|uniref:Arylesterase n=1 Tax=Psychrobacter frigidicola TaxID=45611 RepID=A0A5C7A1I9_9GAMM|nr:arylesterase [Psychrobacter frigidicola]TXD96725.1 arylesterase [Psychrobacter frigidicola]